MTHDCFSGVHFILVLFPVTLMFANVGAKVIKTVDAIDSDMKIMETEPKVQLTRKALVDILHKGQFFQDIFSEHLAPLKIQFGHVCENPNEWEQRFEQNDFKANHHQGKVKWGNKNGGYGEHYWDLNHAGGRSKKADKE